MDAYSRFISLPYTFHAKTMLYSHVTKLRHSAFLSGLSPNEVYAFIRSQNVPPSWSSVDPALVLWVVGLHMEPIVPLGEYLGGQRRDEDTKAFLDALDVYQQGMSLTESLYSWRCVTAHALIQARRQTDIDKVVLALKSLILKFPENIEAMQQCLHIFAILCQTCGAEIDLKVCKGMLSVLHRLEHLVNTDLCDDAGTISRFLIPKYLEDGMTYVQCATHPFFRSHLRNQVFMGGDRFLGALRRQVVSVLCDTKVESLENCDESSLDAAVTIAIQGLLGGFVVSLEAGEAEMIESIETEGSVACPTLRVALLTSMYELVWRTPAVEVLRTKPFTKLLVDRIDEIDQELRLQPRIPRVTKVRGESVGVQDFYEDNVYPVWRNVSSYDAPQYDTVRHFMSLYFPQVNVSPEESDSENILIAGCGSGHHVGMTLAQFKKSHVVGFDLSLANCAYGARQLGGIEGSRHRFCCGDILSIDRATFPGRFDVVECIGTLHHLSDPTEGLRRLLSVVKPGGVVVLGVYNQEGTAGVRLVQSWIRERFPEFVPPFSLEEIHAIRSGIHCLPTVHPVRVAATSFMSFYSSPTFRDTFSHPLVHTFTLTEFRCLTEAVGLRLAGMYFAGCSQDIRARIHYSSSLNGQSDERMCDWKIWEKLENIKSTNPFGSMYHAYFMAETTNL